MCYDRRGKQKEMTLIDDKKYKLRFILPLSEVIIDFFDKLKGMTSGYGSFDYEFIGYEKAPIRKLEIIIMNEPIDTLSFMIHKDRA